MKRPGLQWLLVFSFLVGLLSASPSHAQRQEAPVPDSAGGRKDFYVRGYLRLAETGKPVEHVRVELWRMGGRMIQATYTRSMGDFEFYELPNGIYYVVVQEQEFVPIKEMVEILNFDRNDVFLELTKPTESNLVVRRRPEPTVSARELALPEGVKKRWRNGLKKLYAEGNAEASLEDFQKVLEQAPEFYEAHFQMGRAYEQMGRTAEAEKEYREAAYRGEGKYADPIFALAGFYATQEKYRAAMQLARQGMAISPEAWNGHFEMARALRGMGRVQEALEAVKKAIEKKTDSPESYLLQANIHMAMKDYAEVVKDLDEFLKLDPNGPSSGQARETRDKVKAALAEAGKEKKPEQGQGQG